MITFEFLWEKKNVEPLLTSSKSCNYRISIFGPLLSSVESESVCDQTFRFFDILSVERSRVMVFT